MRKLEVLTTITLLLAAGPLACDRPEAGDVEVRAATPDTTYAPAQLSPKATQSAEPTTMPELVPASDPAPIAADWRGWVASEVARAQAEAPQWAEHVLDVQPELARSGVLRLVDPALEHPAAAPLLLHRLESGAGTPEVRAAIASALGSSGLDVGAIVVELLRTEPDASVREALLWPLRRSEGPVVVEGLSLALADSEARVRASAAMLASRISAGAELAEPLTLALADADLEVRVAAARSLGALKVDDAKPTLTELLAADEAKLRLVALQAIDRIDPAYAEGLAQLELLVTDGDAKVAAAAAKIAAR